MICKKKWLSRDCRGFHILSMMLLSKKKKKKNSQGSETSHFYV